MISPQDLIERITSSAGSEFHECIVILTDKTQANLRWASSTLTTNGVIAERSVTVIAFVAVDGGIGTGAISRTTIELDEIPALLQEVCESARKAGAADDAMEITKNFSDGNWSAPHNATGPDVFTNFAPALGEMFRASMADKIELFGYAEHTHSTTWVGSKGGLRTRHDQPAGRVEMTGKSHDRSRSTWDGVATRDFSNVNIPTIDKKIRERLTWQGKKIDLPAGRYDTVIPAGAVSDLFTYMLWSAAAREAVEGRSAFSKKGGGTRVGEKISNLSTQLFSDSSYKGLESSHFVTASASGPYSSVFDNGQKIPVTHWLKDGVLESLLQTRATAELTAMKYTPIGNNLIMKVDGGSGSLDDVVKKVNDGLLLTCMWYIREVDPSTLLLTGLTRDGVYRVKDGEVIGAVNNFRWNESPISAISRIAFAGSTAITQPREWADDVDRCAMPPLVIAGFNMSTVSQAN